MSDRYVVRYKYFPNNKLYSKTIHKESCRYAKKPNRNNWKGYFRNLNRAMDFCKKNHPEVEFIKLCKVCKPEPVDHSAVGSNRVLNFSEKYFFNIIDEYIKYYRRGVDKYGNVWKVFTFSMITFSLIFLFVAIYLTIFYLP